MIGIAPAMLAGPLIAVAAAVLFPVGGHAVPLASFQPRGSDLHARQDFLMPEKCFAMCNPILATINVSTPHPNHGSRRYHTLNYHSGIRRVAPMQRANARLRT